MIYSKIKIKYLWRLALQGQKLTLTIPEAAKLIGISRGLAYEMAKQKKLPIIEFGNRKLVPRKALLELLDNPQFLK
jgi:excisionase family DNA binding protein